MFKDVGLDVQMAAANRNESESNNTYSLANRIYDDDNMYGRIYSTNTDIDWFVVSFPSSGQANFWLGNIPSGCDYELELYSSNGTTLLKYSRNGGNSDELITYGVSANTNYYIKIYSYKGSSSLFYLLRAKNYPAGDIYEPNNTMATATSISNSTTITNANIHVTGDIDYYRFTVGAMSNISATLSNIPAGCDYDLYLYNSAGVLLSKSEKTNNTNETVSAASVASGNYYLKVISYMGWSNNYYRLALTTTSANPDRYEPNNTTATATNISNNTTITAANIHIPDDVDFYRFTLSSIYNATIDLTNIPVDCDYDLKLCNSSGVEIAKSTKSSNDPEKITATLYPGTYYIQVYSYLGSSNLNYLLALATTVPAYPDRYEPNNTMATATLLANNYATVKDANIHVTTDVDFYKFLINSTMYLALDLNNIPAGCDYDLGLYNSSGTLLSYSAKGGNSPELINIALGTGTYYAHVYPYAAMYSSNNNYRLALRPQKTLSSVPLYTQTAQDTCGSASGIMILKSYGITVSELDFKNKTYNNSGANKDYTIVYAIKDTLNHYLEINNNSTRYRYTDVSSYDTEQYERLILRNILNSHPVQPVLKIPSNNGTFPYSSSGHYVVIKGLTYPDNNGYKAVINDPHYLYCNVYTAPIGNVLSYNKAHSSYIICVDS